MTDIAVIESELSEIYSNACTVGGSHFDFLLKFLSVDFGMQDEHGNCIARVVTKLRISHAFARELQTSLTEALSQHEAIKEVRNLPETM